jgi:hypothetical protein
MYWCYYTLFCRQCLCEGNMCIMGQSCLIGSEHLTLLSESLLAKKKSLVCLNVHKVKGVTVVLVLLRSYYMLCFISFNFSFESWLLEFELYLPHVMHTFIFKSWKIGFIAMLCTFSSVVLLEAAIENTNYWNMQSYFWEIFWREVICIVVC